MRMDVQSKLGSLANWERALSFFRAQDVGLMGKVSKEQELQVLRKFDIFMNVAQFDEMMLSLKLPRTSQIDYVEFLQRFAKNSSSATDAAHGKGAETSGEKKPVATPVCAHLCMTPATQMRATCARAVSKVVFVARKQSC